LIVPPAARSKRKMSYPPFESTGELRKSLAVLRKTT
jgi:hypothetical protein